MCGARQNFKTDAGVLALRLAIPTSRTRPCTWSRLAAKRRRTSAKTRFAGEHSGVANADHTGTFADSIQPQEERPFRWPLVGLAVVVIALLVLLACAMSSGRMNTISASAA